MTAEIIYQMSFTGYGPWFIDRARLTSLDAIIARQRRRLDDCREAAIKLLVEEEVQDYIQNPYLKPKTPEELKSLRSQLDQIVREQHGSITAGDKLEINISGSKRLPVASFQEAMEHPAFYEEKAVGFEARLEHDEMVCTVCLLPNSGILHAHAYPAHIPEVQEFYEEIEDWIASIQAPRWQRLWRRIGGFAWPVWFSTLLLTYVVLDMIDSQPQKYLAEQARKLIRQGVPVEEEHRAIEILLKLASEDFNRALIPTWPVIVFLIGLVAGIVLASPPPHVIMGMGRGENQILRWQNRIRLVSFAVPSFLILSFIVALLPKIFDLLF